MAAMAVMARGKHVFCEKPFALHGAEAREAVDAVEKAGVTLGLGYNRRAVDLQRVVVETDHQRRRRDAPDAVRPLRHVEAGPDS